MEMDQVKKQLDWLDEERRKDPVSVAVFEAQVERCAFEVGGGQLRHVLGDAVERRVAFAQQRAAGLVHEAAERQCADVVDPLGRRARIGDDVLTICVVEIAVVHCSLTLQ